VTAKAKSVANSALALSPDERAELAERLILSLDEKFQSQLTAAWNAGIDRRISEINEGHVTMISRDDALRLIRGKSHEAAVLSGCY
jgi:putative addiction module component (TIGR02574 family)